LSRKEQHFREEQLAVRELEGEVEGEVEGEEQGGSPKLILILILNP
jgi:hypothetical protein